MVQGSRISALNSARWSERVPRWKRRPAATGCCDWPCECRGDWIRTSDLLNPIQGVSRVKCSENTALSLCCGFSKLLKFQVARPIQHLLTHLGQTLQIRGNPVHTRQIDLGLVAFSL